MYIHIGSATVVTTGDIVGIFDIDYCSVSKRTRDYLKAAQDAGRVVNVAEEELPKSFVVCREGDRDVIYVSPISPATLKKRADGGKYTEEERTHAKKK